MEQHPARHNHYVPVWYQRRFIAPGKTMLSYLDQSPAQRELPDGRVFVDRAVSTRAPKSCFWAQDLYTTQFGATLNDEVERYLFGTLDDKGALAIRAFAENDPRAIHDSFLSFFEYLDAQKLRTPKGLDWIKARYPGLSQLDLMLEMQGLRQMHSIMWLECVREIVSAEDSDVKFIVSDHPVTIYNAACPPDSPMSLYPADPAIELVGSQTVFALDANHCLILTNLEYAKNPSGASLTAARTNARYRGRGLVRTDAFIRSRKLSRDEVLAINCLLKRRARRYVGADTEEGLFPERHFAGDWRAIGEILLPRDELWQFGGETYVGYADGSTQYQDQFGRTSGAHDYLHKKRQSLPPGANDPCGCGSGRKYKKCCIDIPEEDRPSWDVYSIRERNLMFCRAVIDILKLNAGKTWDDVRRDLSDEDVKRIHQAFGSLWPSDTDLTTLLPRPTKNAFRAVFLGVMDPRTAAANVTGWAAYFDEVIVPHPFLNPQNMAPKYSPTQSPAQHKEQTLKNVLLLLMLEPYVDAGFIHLIPVPTDFNYDFMKVAFSLAEERTAGWVHDDRDYGPLRKLKEDDLERFVKRLPEASLRVHIRRSSPEIKEDQIDAVMALMKAQLASDPYALLQPLRGGEDGGEAQITKGFSLELAMFMAVLTGGVLYTDMRFHWRELHAHARVSDMPPDVAWQPLADAARSIAFPIELDWHACFQARAAGKFGQIRQTFCRIANAAGADGGSAQAPQLAKELARAVESMRKEWPMPPPATRIEQHLELSIPPGGFDRNTVRRLLLTFGRAKDIRPIPVALFVQAQA